MTTKVGPEVLGLFEGCRTSDVSDALDSLGIMDRQTMEPRMRPLWEGCQFYGLARTVQLFPSNRVLTEVPYEVYDESYGKWTDGSYAWSRMIGETPNEVWVFDERGVSSGLLGSDNTLAGMVRGVKGYVIDGVCRDSDETRMQKGPVFCTLRRPSHVYGRTRDARIDQPIVCAGVRVEAGDVIIADGDGVVVVPQDIAAEVGRRAKLIHEKDMVSRGRKYQQMGWKADETVTFER